MFPRMFYDDAQSVLIRALNPATLGQHSKRASRRNWDNYLHKMNHAYRDMSPVNITLDLWTLFVYLVTVSSPITDRVCTHNTHTAAAV